jgi:hypothetical protein
MKQVDSAEEGTRVMRDLLVGGEIVAAQLASPSHWNPELRLAAAVFTQAMTDVRLRRRDGRDHIQVGAALRWIHADDSAWPLSFLRVCELLQLDPDWVRQTVRRWLRREAGTGRGGAYRHAA